MPDNPPKPIDLPFPPKGLDLSSEYELQPEGTCPVGQNVRLFEPTLSRARGGSRPGLNRFIPQRVNGANPVQHLNFVITHTDDALLAAFDSDGGDGSSRRPRIIDPSTNNREEFPDGGGPMPPGSPNPVPPGGGPTAPGGPNAPGDPRTRRNPPRTVPRGGSGVRPNRRRGSPPIANDDSGSGTIGGPVVVIPVLSNDVYAGTPTVELVSGPNPDFGSLVLDGTVFRYTPPTGGNPFTTTFVYRLTASDMQGSDTAVVTVVVTGTAEFRLMCSDYNSDYAEPEEFNFPLTVCACNNPASPDYTLTFGQPPNQIVAGPFTGGQLPSLADMNAAADAWNALQGEGPFDPPFYSDVAPPVDSGPC